MAIIEPHVHMFSRTTDDYAAMYDAGIRACVEPSFWLGQDRRYAGAFWDYYNLILNFETVRARRFGIDHYCAIGYNPKEAENVALADEVVAGMGEYLDHERCVAIGEIGFNNITDNEERVFRGQLRLAADRGMQVIIHLPHFNKPEGIRRTMKVVREVGFDEQRIYLDHNTEDTMPQARETGCWLGLTVYPISKLTPRRVGAIVRQYGAEKLIVAGSADWGVSDPLSLVKVVDFLKADGHDEQTVEKLVFGNAMEFYSHSPNWKPELDIEPMDPHEFQR